MGHCLSSDWEWFYRATKKKPPGPKRGSILPQRGCLPRGNIDDNPTGWQCQHFIGLVLEMSLVSPKISLANLYSNSTHSARGYREVKILQSCHRRMSSVLREHCCIITAGPSDENCWFWRSKLAADAAETADHSSLPGFPLLELMLAVMRQAERGCLWG